MRKKRLVEIALLVAALGIGGCPTPSGVIGSSTYTMTYSANGGSGAPPIDTAVYTQGQAVTVLGAGGVTFAGFAFANWNTRAGGGGAAYAPGSSLVMGSSNMTLYAQWAANSNQLTFDSNNVSAAGTMAILTLKTGQTANLTQCGYSLAGFTFMGWSSTANGAVAYTDQASYTMGSDSTTLYAVWKSPAKAITAVSVLGTAGTVNQANLTIAVSLPGGSTQNLLGLKATFSTTSLTVPAVTVAGVTQISGTTANDFTSPVSYTVNADDGSTATYVVTVSLPPSCASDSGCNSTDYCDAQNHCVPRGIKGAACLASDQCLSGTCTNNLCQ